MKKLVLAAVSAAALSAGALVSLPTAAVAVDEVCPSGTVGLVFDDGPSSYRPQTLRVLREKLVPASFADIGMRVAANPHITEFEVREGHSVINHSYRHVNMGQLAPADMRREILAAESVILGSGATFAFKGFRAPGGSGNGAPLRQAIADAGYVSVPSNLGGNDFRAETTATTIRDAILNNLSPDRILLFHDGPIDTPAGAAVQEALPQVLDGVRARGYCFGVVNAAGQVVPGRLRPSAQPIPAIVSPVPYKPLLFAGDPPQTPPQPYAIVRGESVRHLSVDVADLVAAGSVVRSLARDLGRLVEQGEQAQLCGNVDAQRRRLREIRALVQSARSSKIDDAGRAALLAQVDRMLVGI
ncbi:polysaccharide deacetylase family protein [Motilibacter aurantiacus]|uniref:polysaccharide deacetylase family protein n=1 Tax=Motilibacter aurantiacus TaxID=2714955 RepID=UPI00140A302B|nr:polysaccharide deacetylase family protein [Motilibacter aurantiacus]NHC46683.1 polysaccharide deacetylase family protein [Motilibacter aurantiacus]